MFVRDNHKSIVIISFEEMSLKHSGNKEYQPLLNKVGTKITAYTLPFDLVLHMQISSFAYAFSLKQIFDEKWKRHKSFLFSCIIMGSSASHFLEMMLLIS